MCEHGRILGRVNVFRQIPHSPSLLISVPLGSETMASLSSFTEFIFFFQNETGSLKLTHYMSISSLDTSTNVGNCISQLFSSNWNLLAFGSQLACKMAHAAWLVTWGNVSHSIFKHLRIRDSSFFLLAFIHFLWYFCRKLQYTVFIPISAHALISAHPSFWEVKELFKSFQTVVSDWKSEHCWAIYSHFCAEPQQFLQKWP